MEEKVGENVPFLEIMRRYGDYEREYLGLLRRFRRNESCNAIHELIDKVADLERIADGLTDQDERFEAISGINMLASACNSLSKYL